jgi:D-threo-aldose 1-dehydrogenase
MKEDKLKRIAIGSTGLSVTAIGFGTAPLGGMPDTYGHDVGEDTARATVRAIFDSPVNLMDTSRNYGLGRAEARIGAVIRERGGLPAGFVLSTKLDRDMDSGRFDADRARRSAEESLTALGVERFQILHLHDPEHARDLDEIRRPGGAIDTLMRMKEEGLAQAVGLAMGRTDLFMELLADWPFDVVLSHNRYSLLNRSAGPLFEQAAARGIAILNAAPFAGGILAKGSNKTTRITYQEADAASLAAVRDIEDICAENEIPTGAAALQFSVCDPRVTSTVIGVSRPDRVQQAIDWALARLPNPVLASLLAIPFSSEDPEANRRYLPG